jgi:hypothetical protein
MFRYCCEGATIVAPGQPSITDPYGRIRRRALAARDARALQLHVAPRKTEGAGKAGCALHPRSRVQDVHKNTHTSIQVQRRASGLPCAMALRLIARSPRRRILVVTVACGLTVLRIPVGFCKTSADLTSATDARTTRLHRTQQPRPLAPAGDVPPAEVLAKALKRRSSARRSIAHRKRPALQFRCAPDAAASTASQPAFVTIATRPSFG